MRRINSHLLGLAAFALAGFLLTASTLTANGSDIRVERPSELRDLVKNQAKKIDDLENQILIVNRQIEKVTNSKEKSQLEILQNKTAKITIKFKFIILGSVSLFKLLKQSNLTKINLTT